MDRLSDIVIDSYRKNAPFCVISLYTAVKQERNP